MNKMEIREILNYLPHRFPFLLIDRVVSLEEGKHIVAIKNVAINEPFFQGHFPGNPVFPGVLMIEGMAQTAGVLCIAATGAQPTSVFFLTIDKAKFRKPVRPGDTIEYHMDRITRRKSMWWYRGEAKVAGQIVAEAQVGAMLSDG